MRKIFTLLAVFLLAALQLWAQNRVVTGKISDENGNPIIRASVQVKGSNVGTTTGEDGSFSIRVPDNARTLLVSFIGMANKEIALTSAANYSVSLTPAASQNMQEVVVVGYGTQTRKEQTGAVATVGGKELENRPFSSLDKMLQGEVPGLLSVAGSGQPGSTQNVRLRGIGSISASSAPLYVIDGIPVIQGDISRLTTTANAFAGINPNDIENITVLKDAASTSIYGSQAANGVILITTKKGRSGKARIRFDVEYGQNDIAYYNDRFRPLNAQEWAAITKEGLINAGNRPGQADTTVRFASTYGASDRGFDTDWFDLVTRRGKQQQYNLSISGGTDRGTYYISGGYYQEDGVTIQSTFKRYTAAIRGKNKVSDRLNITTDISLGFTDQSTPPNSSAFANPAYLALVLMPTRPAYNADGSINISDFDFSGLPFNPLYLAEHDKRQLNGLKGLGNLSGEFTILKNLKYTSRFGIDYNSLEESRYLNPYHGDARNDFGQGYAYYTRDFNMVWTNFADYSHSFLNGALKADVKVGYESYKRVVVQNSLRADGFPPSMDLTLSANGATPKTASATQNDKKRLSAFSNLILNYSDRYILSGSFRRDGSSVFGAKNRFGNFWSVGAAWNVDQENWFAKINAISSLKLRGSYGVNGNESGFGYYEAVTTYGYTGYNYNQQTGSAPNNVGDPELTWELNKPFNVGLDLGLLKNRITLTTDYYNRTTADLLLAANTSRTTGWSSYTTNVGEMQNKGVEVGIKAIPVQTKDLTWTVNLNFAYNKNRITALYQNKDVTDGSYVLSVGYDYRTFYTRLWAGVDPANGDPLWYTDNTKSKTTNNVNQASLAKVGTATPNFFGGFSNTVSYKGFTLDFQFNFAGGHYQRDGLGSLYLSDGASATRGKVKKQLERWQKPGDITNVPKYVINGNKNSNTSSTRYLYKADHARLRNLQIAYSFTNSMLNRIKLQGLSLYVRGTNLFTLVKDKDLPWDPEQGINNQFAGDVFIPKTVTVGLNVSF